MGHTFHLLQSWVKKGGEWHLYHQAKCRRDCFCNAIWPKRMGLRREWMGESQCIIQRRTQQGPSSTLSLCTYTDQLQPSPLHPWCKIPSDLASYDPLGNVTGARIRTTPCTGRMAAGPIKDPFPDGSNQRRQPALVLFLSGHGYFR